MTVQEFIELLDVDPARARVAFHSLPEAVQPIMRARLAEVGGDHRRMQKWRDEGRASREHGHRRRRQGGAARSALIWSRQPSGKPGISGGPAVLQVHA